MGCRLRRLGMSGLMLGAALSFLARDARSEIAMGSSVPLSTALPDLSGRFLSLGDLQATQAPGLVLVLAFLSVKDPASRAAAGDVGALFARYARKGVECALVFSNQGETREMARRFLAETRLPGTALFDPGAVVGRGLGLAGTPGFCIIDRDGTLRYRGVFESKAEGTRTPRLENALRAVIAGRPVEVADARGECAPFQTAPSKPPAPSAVPGSGPGTGK